jgi:hypothetical protein
VCIQLRKIIEDIIPQMIHTDDELFGAEVHRIGWGVDVLRSSGPSFEVAAEIVQI